MKEQNSLEDLSKIFIATGTINYLAHTYSNLKHNAIGDKDFRETLDLNVRLALSTLNKVVGLMYNGMHTEIYLLPVNNKYLYYGMDILKGNDNKSCGISYEIQLAIEKYLRDCDLHHLTIDVQNWVEKQNIEDVGI